MYGTHESHRIHSEFGTHVSHRIYSMFGTHGLHRIYSMFGTHGLHRIHSMFGTHGLHRIHSMFGTHWITQNPLNGWYHGSHGIHSGFGTHGSHGIHSGFQWLFHFTKHVVDTPHNIAADGAFQCLSKRTHVEHTPQNMLCIVAYITRKTSCLKMTWGYFLLLL